MRDSATRKCNCPFSIRGVYISENQWKVQVICGVHNHDLPNSLVGHPYAGRLTKEEKKFVAELSISGVKPKDVLCGLKRRHEDNASTMKTIYNAKTKLRIHEMEGRTAMQQLLKVLVAKHYVYWYRSDETTDEVLDLFWANPSCILLAKCFPSVVIVDCTYKTNKYKMPLFAMVGITSTAKTFSIAHCFLYKEMEDNYQWALSKLKSLFEPHDIPSVFITDRESAVIKAIRGVFPDARHMLCMFHITKNVEQYYKPMFQTTSVWTKLFDDWQLVTKSTSEEEFFTRWEELKKDWSEFPNCIDYLTRTWFPHREAFVLAWTNRIKHRGNRTMNRAEGSYGKLKKHLDNGVGTFFTVFEGMHNMLDLQLNEVKAVFERSLGSVKEIHGGMLFKELRGRLSHFALDVIKKERDRSIDIGLDPSACNHVVRTVYGLPCACELLQYNRENRPIPFDAVDEHWKRLTILPNTEDKNQLIHTVEFGLLKKLYDQSTEDEKKVLLRKLKDLATPTTTSLREPKPVIPKGRPRGSKNKLSQKEKHEKSTKRDPSGFEYAKTVERIVLLQQFQANSLKFQSEENKR